MPENATNDGDPAPPARRFSELWSDLGSGRILPAVSIGLVIGILSVILSLSYAAMIFSGPLSPLALRGAGPNLWGTLVLCIAGTMGSAVRTLIGKTQDAPTAVMSTVAVAVAAVSTVEAQFMTLTALMLVSSLLSGGAFLLIGRFHLANLLRFMPYPVVGGFLAGSGWLLTMGSFSVMCGIAPSPDTLSALLAPAAAAKWLPGVAYAAVVFTLMRRWSHFLLLPGSMLLAAILFYIGFAVTGMSADQARAAGFLLSGMPAEGLWPAFAPADLALVNWSVVAQQVPVLLTVVMVTVVGMLFNMSGIEMGCGSEVDMGREFTTIGIGNLFAGLGGSVSGYPSISMSLLGHKTGADSRWTGLTAAAVVGGVLFAGGWMLEFFPKPLLGGLLLLLGLFFIHDWVIQTRRRLPLADYAIVVSIFLVIGIFGFMKGVAFGLVATVVFFVVRFSRVPVVAAVFTAENRRSLRQRPIPHRRILASAGRRIVGHELCGYLFFGSAATLAGSLKTVLAARPRPAFLILDFRQVSGFDVSAINHFHRFVLNTAGTTLVFTAAPERFTDALRRHLPPPAAQRVAFFPDLDRGLEWCEDAIIQECLAADPREALFDDTVDEVIGQLTRQEDFETLVERLAPWLRVADFATGEAITTQGQAAEGLHLIVSGEAEERHPESGGRRRTLVAGDVATVGAAFDGAPADATVTATDACQTAVLTAAALRLLELENPDQAICLQRYLIRKMAQ